MMHIWLAGVIRQAEVWLDNEHRRGIGGCIQVTCSACQESPLRQVHRLRKKSLRQNLVHVFEGAVEALVKQKSHHAKCVS